MNKTELEELFKRKIEHYQEMLQGEHDDLADCIKIDIKELYNKTFDVLHHLEDELERYYTQKIEDTKKQYQVGMIDRNKNHVYFTQHVGDGSGTTNDGRKIKFELLLGATTYLPIIRYKTNYYILTWNEIIQLAENAGLFNEETDK